MLLNPDNSMELQLGSERRIKIVPKRSRWHQQEKYLHQKKKVKIRD